MKRLLIILLTYASFALAEPYVRVTIRAEGEGSDLVLQACTATLRNTPGVEVVPFGEQADAQIGIVSVALRNKIGEAGYAWATVITEPKTLELLAAPSEGTAGDYQGILQAAASNVQSLDRKVLTKLREQK